MLSDFRKVIEHPVNVDFHIHSKYTDGLSTVDEYINRAIQLNIQEIAFTEHVRKTSSWYPSFVEDVERLREDYGNKIRIYHGIEAKVLNMDGDIDASDDMLDTAEIILGSVHRFPDFCNVSLDANNLGPRVYAEIEYQLSTAILKNPEIDVLAHPGGMYIRMFARRFPRNFLKNLIELAIRHDTAIEINRSYLKDVGLDTDLFFQMNPYVSLGSDAHSIEDLGSIIKFINPTT